MPIEIKELIVQTTVTTNPKPHSQANLIKEEEIERLKTEIKKECLDWLIEYLEAKKMR
jgi:hypothetical protein